MTFKQVNRLPDFDKDLKRMLKKYRTLEEDLMVFEDTALKMYHHLKKDNGGIFRIPNLGIEHPKIYKAKKFACKALKGGGANSGIRVIYAYFDNEDKIEYIEIYHKNEKENEDKNRIEKKYQS